MGPNKLLPIEYVEWSHVNEDDIEYFNVTFIENWGIFKKGDTVFSVLLLYDNSLVIVYNYDNKELFKCNVVLTPKPE